MGIVKKTNLLLIDYQLLREIPNFMEKAKSLIMSVFHDVPRVPCAKMERWNALYRPEKSLYLVFELFVYSFFKICNFLFGPMYV
ncbi:hypothetical protein MgSA37_01433 [Mucilaginibacter gotjawali]|uniref:Uncharacterized protein n=2 Tax=Mucilaginibacter gotjawali TaxID=1550579 RepID=A0A110B4T0_9SPHI|nr:hypothetical protein [Mucilaginibacter gotjawali]BAU53266.1 hypothetical protein MgSA37_01433 [Mucilaginibacter gotjawali]